MKTLNFLLAFIFCSMASTHAQENPNSIEVTVDNIKSAKGTILIALYTSEKNFLKKAYKYDKVEAKENKITYTFKNVPAGEYAVSLYHDKDDNGKLNSFMGIPTEAYGSSNNAPSKFGPPKWKDAKFTLSNEKVVQEISL